MADKTQMSPRRPLQVTEEVIADLGGDQERLSKAKAEGKPVVAATGHLPYDVFRVMDIPVVCLELLGTMASFSGLSAKYCQIAEENDVSRDVCAFTRCALGFLYAGEELDPVMGGAYVPPDLAVGHTLWCTGMSKGCLHPAQHLNLPYFLIDIPANKWGKEMPDYAMAYCVQQWRELITFLETFGYKMDWDRLKEEIEFSRRVSAVQKEIETYMRAIPAPVAGMDTMITPLWSVQQGGKRVFHLLEKKRDELKKRVEEGIGVIDNEKLRLGWFFVPPFSNPELVHYAEKDGAVVVATWSDPSTVGYDADVLDPDHPLESIVRKMVCDCNTPLGPMPDAIVQYVRDLRVDGVILATTRSCSTTPPQFRRIKDRLVRAEIPTVMFDADWADSREIDEAAIKANLDSFVATLLAKKGA